MYSWLPPDNENRHQIIISKWQQLPEKDMVKESKMNEKVNEDANRLRNYLSSIVHEAIHA